MYFQFLQHNIISKGIYKGFAGFVIAGLMLGSFPFSVAFAEEDTAPAQDTPATEEPATQASGLETEATPETIPEGTSPKSSMEAVPGVTLINKVDTSEEPSTAPEADAENPTVNGEPLTQEQTTIETGDAVAVSDIENTVNTNTTETETDLPAESTETPAEEPSQDEGTSTTETTTSDDTEEGATTDATGTTSDVPEDEEGTTEEIPTTQTESAGDEEEDSANNTTSATTITTENDADIENSVGVAVNTGGNNADNNENTIIETGDAIAVSNIVNVANTNIFNSTGFLLLLMQAFSNSRDLDLRNLDFFQLFNNLKVSESNQNQNTDSNEDEDSVCSLGACGGTDYVEVDNNNDATITNTVIVRSNTGDNNANNGGDASINTGDAYAGSNVLNIVNTNIIDSNYLLLSLANFGDWNGDIVFPAASFFDEFFTFGNDYTPSTSIENNNEADVENNVGVSADTGNNSANNNEDAGIETGNAYASSAIANQVNTNLFGTDSFMLMFRLSGGWSGNVFGLPEGFSIEDTANGLAIYGGSDDGTDDDSDIQEIPDSVQNNNIAEITNNIQVVAVTGGNNANGNDNANIGTGDAYAASNVVNVVNTNVIGRNWVLALFNLLGNWGGDISFGRPDLWIGGRAALDNDPMGPEDMATYYYTITNNGDAIATDVVVTDEFDTNYLNFKGSNSGAQYNSGRVTWELGDIAPGETEQIEYKIEVDSYAPYGNNLLVNTANVTSTEEDENIADNTEQLSMYVERNLPNRNLGGVNITYTARPNLVLEKSNNAPTTTATMASTTVAYEITIVNNSDGPAYDATLVDTLRDEDGNTVDTGEWYLGEISPREEITISYDLFFEGDTETGTYTNSAEIMALGGYPEFMYGYTLKSNIATSEIEIEGIPQEIAITTGEGEGSEEDIHGESRQETLPEDSTVEESNEIIADLPEEIASEDYTESGTLAYRSRGGDYAITQASISSTSRKISNLLAATFFAFPDNAGELLLCALPILIVFYLIAYLVWKAYQDTAQKHSWKTACTTSKCTLAFFVGATLIGYAVAALTDFTCILVPFIIALVIIATLYVAEKYKN